MTGEIDTCRDDGEWGTACKVGDGPVADLLSKTLGDAGDLVFAAEHVAEACAELGGLGGRRALIVFVRVDNASFGSDGFAFTLARGKEVLFELLIYPTNFFFGNVGHGEDLVEGPTDAALAAGKEDTASHNDILRFALESLAVLSRFVVSLRRQFDVRLNAVGIAFLVNVGICLL